MPNTGRNKQGSSFRDHISTAARMTQEQRASQRTRTRDNASASRQPATSTQARSGQSRRAQSSTRADAKRATSGERRSARSDERRSARAGQQRSDAATRPARRERSEGEEKPKRGLPAGKSRVALVVVGILVLCCVVLYPVGKDYYHSVREGQRLHAQIDAVSERNKTLEEETESLQTDEGIEAQARNDYNYVKEGEHAASVTNAQGSSGSTDLPAQVDEDDIHAPQTWYYTILDVIFFYSD